MHKSRRVPTLASLLAVVMVLGGCEDEKPLVQPKGLPPVLVINDASVGIEPFRYILANREIELLFDSNTQTPGSDSRNGAVIGTQLLFAANDGLHGQELWVTDGELAHQVAELCPGICGRIRQILASGTLAYIVARGPGGGDALWVSDGSASGTRLLRAEQAVADDYRLQVLANITGGTLIAVSRSNGDVNLWRSDGTVSGTVTVRTVATGIDFFPQISPAVSFAGKAWFAIEDQLWSSDGSDGGSAQLPVTVHTDPEGMPIAPVLLNGAVYVGGAGNAASVTVVAATQQMQSGGSALCYWADRELHVTDGSAGNDRVAVVRNGDPDGSLARVLAASGGCYFLTHNESAAPSDTLWLARTDQADNVAVQVFPAELRYDSFTEVGHAGGRLLFMVQSAPTGSEAQLWSVDNASAEPIADLAAKGGLGMLGNTLLFNGNGEIWRSDGTGAGTRQIADINQVKTGDGWPDRVLRSEGSTYFKSGGGIFITDGTPAGTNALTPRPPLAMLQGVSTTHGVVYIEQNTTALELRRYNSTAADSSLLDSACIDYVSRQSGFIAGGGFVFAVVSGCGELLLWKSDGTAAGTTRVMLDTIATWAADMAAEEMISSIALWRTETRVYVSVCYLESRCEIFVSDGTQPGTSLLGETGHFHAGVVLGETLFLVGGYDWTIRTATHSPARVGATPAALLPAGIFAYAATRLGNQLVFSAFADTSTAPPDQQLWRSDGTATGTQLLVRLGNRVIADWAVAGETIFFTLAPNESSVNWSSGELWRSDGTPAGTLKLADAVVTTQSIAAFTDCPDGRFWLAELLARTSPKLFVGSNEVWFLRKNAASGIDLWFSNGTVGGTRQMTNLPGNGCEIAGLL